MTGEPPPRRGSSRQRRSCGVVALLVLASTLARAAEPCDAQLGQSIFAMCSACHTVDPLAPAREGPHLAAIVGRRSASVPGFGYSDALRRTNWVWTEEQLDRFLVNPRKVLPGTLMTFVGLKDAEDRRALVCYLKTVTG